MEKAILDEKGAKLRERLRKHWGSHKKLAKRCGISLNALYRHLDGKLKGRDEEKRMRIFEEAHKLLEELEKAQAVRLARLQQFQQKAANNA